MSTWKKAPPVLVERFDAALPPDAQRRTMFGFPCAFVGGNMAAGLHEDRLIVRVPDAAASHPCVILGRTMKQYALIPDAASLPPETLRDWIARGMSFTRTMPPKAAKTTKAAKSAKVPQPAKAATAAKPARHAKPAKTKPPARPKP